MSTLKETLNLDKTLIYLENAMLKLTISYTKRRGEKYDSLNLMFSVFRPAFFTYNFSSSQHLVTLLSTSVYYYS